MSLNVSYVAVAPAWIQRKGKQDNEQHDTVILGLDTFFSAGVEMSLSQNGYFQIALGVEVGVAENWKEAILSRKISVTA